MGNETFLPATSMFFLAALTNNRSTAKTSSVNSLP